MQRKLKKKNLNKNKVFNQRVSNCTKTAVRLQVLNVTTQLIRNSLFSELIFLFVFLTAGQFPSPVNFCRDRDVLQGERILIFVLINAIFPNHFHQHNFLT